MTRMLQTAGVLATFWMMLSGRTDTLFLVFGLISVLITMLVSWLMWPETPEHPEHMLSPFRPVEFVRYCGWLFGQIIAANIAVIRAVLRAEPELNPSLAKYRASAETALGRAILANSITLTPGTVVVEMTGSATLVHALLDPMDDSGSFDQIDAKSLRITSRENNS